MAWSNWQSVGAKGTLLWENSKPSNVFGKQTITIQTNGTVYESVLIIFLENTSWGNERVAYFDKTHQDNEVYFDGKVREIVVHFDNNNNKIEVICEHDNDVDINVIPYRIIGLKKDIIKEAK